jgi:hypothetical protein
MDDSFNENVEKIDFTRTLQPATKLSTVFPAPPAEGQLHFVVEAPLPVSEPDMTHPAEKGGFPLCIEVMCVDDAFPSACQGY